MTKRLWLVLVVVLSLLGCGRTEIILAPDPICGNGRVDTGEECDDGTFGRHFACTRACKKNVCGDGIIRAGVEMCDEGMATDTCSATCTVLTCGNGVREGFEDCDDQNTDNGDACLSTCMVTFCGDGFLKRGLETCDDGNEDLTDACLPSCVAARCGDGFVQKNIEACDDANGDDGDSCVSGCRAASCGDGFIERGVEACDDGNTNNGDACVQGCTPARCGDGFTRQGLEGCDDANGIDDDGCDNRCQLPVCGDGKRAGAEACDLGAANGDTPAFLITQTSGTRIGTDALVRGQTVQQFYDYRSASSHTGLEQVGESRIYLFADSRTGRLSLVLTHGIDFDSSNQAQPQSTVEMNVAGLPPGVVLDVIDDSASEFFLGSPGTAFGRWSFDRNSDGGALGPLPFPGNWRVTVTPRFTAGITTWGWVKDDGTRIALDMSKPITIEAQDKASQCRTSCTVPACGDGVFDAGEVCDDGNTRDGDKCSADCRRLQ